MTSFEHSFICGLLKEYKPKKILEVGVASGGTTAIILKCIQKLGLNSMMYSVDISEKWYRNPDEKTGFLVDEFDCGKEGSHEFLLGKPLPYYIDKIGKNVDFLMLDTSHSLPGELLDFLICLPYLKDGCIVVLHDVMESVMQKRPTENATKLLFDTVSATKYYMLDEDNFSFGLSNIAAFQINEETREHIADVFSALSNHWAYFFNPEDEEKYLKIMGANYNAEYVHYLKRIMEVHKYYKIEMQLERQYGNDLFILKQKWKNKKVYLYGAGYFAKCYLSFAEKYNLPVEGIVVSDDQEVAEKYLCGKRIYKLSELKEDSDCFFVLALDRRYWRSVVLNLKYKGFNNVL